MFIFVLHAALDMKLVTQAHPSLQWIWMWQTAGDAGDMLQAVIAPCSGE